MCRFIRTNNCGLSSWRLVAVFVVGVCCVGFASPLLAQSKGPGDISHELAAAKAAFFERVTQLESEPTTNQDFYDAKYYWLNLDMDPTTSTVSGTVTMTAEVVTGPLGLVDIDLYSDLTVDSVIMTGGGSLAYTHINDILSVTLDRSYAASEIFSIEVTYHGTPSLSAGAFEFDTYGGEPMIWSLSEPFGARTWWPCKDYSHDKADSVDIWITVPEALSVASNGLLLGTVDNGATMTYKWHEKYPIATYLVSVAAHPYTVFSDYYHYSPTDSMELRYYVFPDHYSAVQENYGKVPAMITVFAGLYGEYPFLDEKYGHAEFTWGGGMEHQTITSLGGYGEYLICHELAHMWWGDMITCADFHHIWLNEGFAVYSEALWAEHAYGWAVYKQQMEYAKYLGAGTIYVPDLSDWNRIFDGDLTYNKASWIPHMIRGIVGDSLFYDIIEAYYGSQYQYRSCTTEQFRDICETVTGRDFDQFFHQWVYEEGFPFYHYTWSYEAIPSSYEISLTIEQLQENEIFHMPIQVTVTTAAGETTLVVEDSLAMQEFSLIVEDEPLAIELDKEEWILRMISEEITGTCFDRGILVVNGVHWGTYGTEITSAYEDSIFWGSHDISFWDLFAEPAGGYPSTLPAPLNHGGIPEDTLKQFSSVVWIGNNYSGDLPHWYNASILSYLRAGGNLLLMTRMGQDFVYEALRSYLDIQWAEARENTTQKATSVYTGLADMARSGGTQSYNAVFDTSLVGDDSEVLFVQLNLFDPPRGLGVWANPPEGGTIRRSGGQFVFISGRPYRYDHDALRSNTEYILTNFFGEPYDPAGIPDNGVSAGRIHLAQNSPNPFNPTTRIAFSLPYGAEVRMAVYDVQGREVVRLVDKDLDPGKHTVTWSGRDAAGRKVASGVYWYLLQADNQVSRRKMVLLK
ncbi:MAG: M1 family aminopeptidase [Candidatus Eisenbacteria bacterium]